MKPLAILAGIALTVLCWGAYGPVLHQGQHGLDSSRLKPLICVGIAYFVVAIIVPIIVQIIVLIILSIIAAIIASQAVPASEGFHGPCRASHGGQMGNEEFRTLCVVEPEVAAILPRRSDHDATQFIECAHRRQRLRAEFELTRGTPEQQQLLLRDRVPLPEQIAIVVCRIRCAAGGRGKQEDGEYVDETDEHAVQSRAQTVALQIPSGRVLLWCRE